MSVELNSIEIKEIVEYTIDNNIRLAERGIVPISIKITGEAGIGKTSVIKQVAQSRGYQYVKLSLAEITVDDLIGYPIIVHQVIKDEQHVWIPEKVIDSYLSTGWSLTGKYRMSYGVPEKLAPYIGNDVPIVLTLDDANRASISLLQAVMEICEEGRYTSWELPKGSTVILSCNPEDGDYIVTSTDKAHKTRSLSYNMKFDVDCWVSEFAERSSVPDKGINFIMQHPEVVTGTKDHDETGERELTTNIRIWTKFFYTIQDIGDWNKDINLITKLAGDSIPHEHIIIFTAYINNRLAMLPSCAEILEADSTEIIEKLKKITRSSDGTLRSDIAAIVCKRLMNHAAINGDTFTDKNMEVYCDILMSDIFTEDLKFLSLRKIAKIDKLAGAMITSKPEIKKMYLESL